MPYTSFFHVPYFWYKLIFAAELMVAEGLATYTLQKRDHFGLRVAAGMAAVFAVAFLLPVPFASPIVNMICSSGIFLIIFFLTVGAMKFCFAEKSVTLFFCGVVAYTTQHLSYTTYRFLVDTFGVKAYNSYGAFAPTEVDGSSYFLYFLAYAVIYWFVWAFVEHSIREQEKLKIEPLLIGAFSMILLADVVLSLVVTYLLEGQLTQTANNVLYLYQLISSLFGYMVLVAVLGRHLAEQELETVETLWRQDRKNYELSRENVEMINLKCHDLKHQIRRLKGAGGTLDDTFLQELENSVAIYDNSLKTGNAALDLLFAEKSMLFARHHIRLSVIADGDCLSMLSDADIYSFFGNAIQNAVESLLGTEDTEKRLICLRIHPEGMMAAIHMENWCRSVTYGENGLPRTNKEEHGHGYGMLSMQKIVAKYGGFLSTELVDQQFHLDALIPRHST